MLNQQSQLPFLVEQITTTFLATLTLHKDTLLARRKAQIYAEVFELMKTIIENTLRQPHDEAYEKMLILCCLEHPALFTTTPDMLEYVTDDTERKPMAAEQSVYHNLCEHFQEQLEQAFERWYEEQRPDTDSGREDLSEVCAELVKNGGVELSAVPTALAEIPDKFPDGEMKKGAKRAYHYTLVYEGRTMQGYWFGPQTLEPPTLPGLLCNLMLSCYETRNLHEITDHCGGYALKLRYVLGDALLYRLLDTEWDI